MPLAKDTPQDWHKRIESGYKYREKYGFSKDWPTYRAYYRGEFPGYLQHLNSAEAVLPFNLTYLTKNTIVPNVYFRNPYLSATPRFKSGFEINAKIVEAIDNWLISEMAFKQQARHAVGNCYFTNRGLFKIGYDSKFGFDPKQVKQETGDSTSTNFDRRGKNMIEYDAHIRPGMPWVESLLSEHVVVPFGTRTLETAHWVDHIILRRLEDVKADTKYDSSVTKDLTGSHLEWINKDSPNNLFYNDLQQDDDWVELHEIRDQRDGRIKVYASGNKERWLRHEPDVLQIDGLPFADFTFNDDTEYFWGAPDARIIEPQQLEMNETRTQTMFHRRIALLKFLYKDGSMSKEELAKFLSETVAVGVKVTGDPKTAIEQIQPHIPQDLGIWAEAIRRDAQELLGVGRMQAGMEQASSRRTAREADLTQLGFETRVDERRDRMADALTTIMRKVNQIIFSFWQLPRIIQVIGFDGATYWVQFDASAIRGEYNLQVDIESLAPASKKMRRQELIQLVQALAKYPGANLDYLIRSLLREFPYVDAMKILPEAPETMGGRPMQYGQFQQQQQRLMGDQGYREARVARNAGALSAGKM